jgi:hypothetical protein
MEVGLERDVRESRPWGSAEEVFKRVFGEASRI